MELTRHINSPIVTELARHDLQFCLLRAPKELLKLMKNETFNRKIFIAGGFIRSVIANEPINDIDLFVPNEGLAHILSKMLSDGGTKREIKTDNAITIPHLKPAVQIIHRWTFAGPYDCAVSFDFTVCQAVIWFEDGEWKSACHSNFYQDLASKRLVYTSPERDEDAGGSMLRVLKYYQKGYRIPLDSFAAVIARLASAVDFAQGVLQPGENKERFATRIIRGLLREVDPDVDPKHIAHLPAEEASDSSGTSRAVLTSTDKDVAF